MDITPVIAKSQQVINGYGNGGFKINNEFVAGSLVVFPDRIIAWDGKFASLLSALSPAGEGKIELLLIGSGNAMAILPDDIRQTLRAQNIAVEVMDTGAACRTYNILLSESRRVAAALVAV